MISGEGVDLILRLVSDNQTQVCAQLTFDYLHLRLTNMKSDFWTESMNEAKQKQVVHSYDSVDAIFSV